MASIEEFVRRIIAALRFRVRIVSKTPPISELEFIAITGNHGQFRAKLQSLDQISASNEVEKFSHHVGLCWLRLSIEHLEDARQSLPTNRSRAIFSRSYYAAYNASKAVRYIVSGVVSLKGDDHHKASSELPDDFPDVNKWSEIVTDLYEHRLRADYDNWNSTGSENTMTAQQAFEQASEFVSRCRAYLGNRLGVPL